jgi:hypothetical protein
VDIDEGKHGIGSINRALKLVRGCEHDHKWTSSKIQHELIEKRETYAIARAEMAQMHM